MGDFEKFYNKALRFLSYRPRSEKEIREYLIRKTSTLRHSGKRSQVPDGTWRSASRISNGSERFWTSQNDEGRLILDKVIQKLKEQNFINDSEFAKWWIEQRTEFKPRSLRLIKLELKQKGISNEIIESRIMNQESRGDLERAKELVKKRIEKFRGLPKRDVYERLGSYLARRGFDWETIKKGIDELLSR